ncbi:MAG: GNAT family N-acetyltransferase [Candidatus Latescibacteria bacterium]|nr:GNAT family N-acetyltransferase [Candidatus Latescibacterota bacterium]
MKLKSPLTLAAPPDPAAWDALVEGADGATVFHTAAWAELWRSEWRDARWIAFVLEDDRGYAGGIPAIVRHRGIGRTVFSMPHGTYGGPLVRAGHPDPASVRRDLLDAYARFAGSRWTLRSELTWFRGALAEIPPGLDAVERFTHVLPLKPDFASLAASFSSPTRRMARQAEESGLSIRSAGSEADVRSYYALAVEAVRRRGGTPKPYSVYSRILETLVPSGRARFHLVEHEGIPVAGSLHLFHRGAVTNWLTVSRQTHWHLRPNNFLIARVLESLCEAGYLEYNFGASPPDAAGLIRFKEGWGAAREALVVAGRRSALYRKLRG